MAFSAGEQRSERRIKQECFPAGISRDTQAIIRVYIAAAGDAWRGSKLKLKKSRKPQQHLELKVTPKIKKLRS